MSAMMDLLKESLWKQFGASIDMLGNAITQCPDEYWNTHRTLFNHAYHCLVFLDYYLTIPSDNFSSPLPFSIAAPADIPAGAIDDIVPHRIYSKPELMDYLHASRTICHALIEGLTEEKSAERWSEGADDRSYAMLELLLYNMRHVQHHVAQLNLLLRQGINHAPGWVARAAD